MLFDHQYYTIITPFMTCNNIFYNHHFSLIINHPPNIFLSYHRSYTIIIYQYQSIIITSRILISSQSSPPSNPHQSSMEFWFVLMKVLSPCLSRSKRASGKQNSNHTLCSIFSLFYYNNSFLCRFSLFFQ